MTFNITRRRLLSAGALAPFAGAGAPMAMNLALMGAAQAQTSDYKALVCLYLSGGNDSHNMVLATDAASWAPYVAARSVAPDPIALLATGIPGGVLPIVALNPQPGRTFGIHPTMTDVKALFDAERLSVVANVGPLVAPTSKAQYTAKSVPLPRSLFSHNDQTSTWQSGTPEGARVGWGGKMADLLASMNAQTMFTCVSASGNAVLLSGRNVIQYQVSNAGAITIGGLAGSLFGSSSAANPLRAILTNDRSDPFERAQARLTQRSIDAQASVSAALVPAASLEAIPTFGGTTNPLAMQLQTVARMIGGRTALGARRQVFFVSMGGFDTHDRQNIDHTLLLGRLSQALGYFDRLLGSAAVNARAETTLFTASEFGRTLTSNGDGTDHGWGSHHLVMGGSVSGARIVGRFPEIGLNTPDDVGQGRLLPVSSVDQYAATMGAWFGLSAAQLDDIFPNLANFGSARNLGFMQP
jgi:uncharacterized protein (DUF1501 family)